MTKYLAWQKTNKTVKCDWFFHFLKLSNIDWCDGCTHALILGRPADIVVDWGNCIVLFKCPYGHLAQKKAWKLIPFSIKSRHIWDPVGDKFSLCSAVALVDIDQRGDDAHICEDALQGWGILWEERAIYCMRENTCSIRCCSNAALMLWQDGGKLLSYASNVRMVRGKCHWRLMMWD